MKHRPTETPFLMKRKGVFCELSALKRVIPQVGKLLEALPGDINRGELMEKLRLKDRMHFGKDYLQPALAAGLIEMIIPDKPRSSKQKYRLTDIFMLDYADDFHRSGTFRASQGVHFPGSRPGQAPVF